MLMKTLSMPGLIPRVTAGPVTGKTVAENLKDVPRFQQDSEKVESAAKKALVNPISYSLLDQRSAGVAIHCLVAFSTVAIYSSALSMVFSVCAPAERLWGPSQLERPNGRHRGKGRAGASENLKFHTGGPGAGKADGGFPTVCRWH